MFRKGLRGVHDVVSLSPFWKAANDMFNAEDSLHEELKKEL